MFCGKCGSQIEKDSVFCQNCGNRVTEPDNNQPAATNTFTNINTGNSKQPTVINAETLKFMWQPLAAALLMLFSLFQGWIKIEYIGQSISLRDIKKLGDFIGSYDYVSSDLSKITLFINIIYYASWIAILAEIAFIATKIIKDRHFDILGKAGSLISILLVLTIFYLTYKFMSEFGGMSIKDIPLTIFPFVTLAASIWQLISRFD